MASRIAVRVIRLVNSAIRLSVMIVVLSLLGMGVYAMWDAQQVYNSANSTQYAIYKPSAEDEGKSFAELQAINPDVFGWLTVYGTHIDYPVLYSNKDSKYINTDVEGNYSLSGAIFLDKNNHPGFSDFASIIYGHHMEKQKMFGEIDLFFQQEYSEHHRYGNLYFDGKDHGLEFIAFVRTDAYDKAIYTTGITDPEKSQVYADYLLSKATNIHDGVVITPKDRIVLLSTCAAFSTNGREILVGKIKDEVYPDPFQKTKSISKVPSIDQLASLWMQAPLYLRSLLLSLPPLGLLLFILIRRRRPKCNN